MRCCVCFVSTLEGTGEMGREKSLHGMETKTTGNPDEIEASRDISSLVSRDLVAVRLWRASVGS